MTNAKKSRSEIKREAIIEAAKSAFQQFGVQATSMDKLSEIAAVSKRTVYNHFATKSELVMYLLTEMWEATMIKSPVVYKPGKPVAGQLTILVQDQIELLTNDQHTELARVAIGNFFYEPEALKKEIDRLVTQETVVHRFIKAAGKDKALKLNNVNCAIEQLNDLIKGRCFWPMVFKMQPALNKKEKQFVAQQIVDTFLARYLNSSKNK